MKHLLQETLDDAVALGGFTWSFGFLLGKLGNRNMGLFAATNRPQRKTCFDTRSLSGAELERFWNATGTGDCATIMQIIRTQEATRES